MTKTKWRHFAVVVVFIFGMIFFVVMFLKYVPHPLFKTLIKPLKMPQAPPEETFRQYVLSPIPKSVTNIKADQPSEIFDFSTIEMIIPTRERQWMQDLKISLGARCDPVAVLMGEGPDHWTKSISNPFETT